MSDSIVYRGFDTPDQNARDVEIWLGDRFLSHIPSRNRIEFHIWSDRTAWDFACAGEALIRSGDEIVPLTPDDYQRWLAL